MIKDRLKEKQVEKTIEDIKNILKIVGERAKLKKGSNLKTVYLYVLPQEKKNYDANRLGERLDKVVKVYAVNDKDKYDPEGKSKKVRPGRPGIFVE